MISGQNRLLGSSKECNLKKKHLEELRKCFGFTKKAKLNHTCVIVSSLTVKSAAVDGRHKIPVIFILCFSLLLPSLSFAGSKVRLLLSQFW